MIELLLSNICEVLCDDAVLAVVIEVLAVLIGEVMGEVIGEIQRPLPCKLGQSRPDAGIVMIQVFISIRAEFIGNGAEVDGTNNFLLLFPRRSSQELIQAFMSSAEFNGNGAGCDGTNNFLALFPRPSSLELVSMYTFVSL